MTKYIALFGFALLGSLGFSTLSNIGQAKDIEAIQQSNTPIVLEMFTSQSCSSCPPADRLLGTLEASNDNIIALSCNVTYWNHLHWEDTLSKDFCDIRQRQYVGALTSRGPYTPQIFVNGGFTGVGSRPNVIEKAIEKTHSITPIHISSQEKNLKITLPALAQGDYNILLMPYGHSHWQDIPSGENKGRNVDYTNPILDIIDLGLWQGEERSFHYNIAKLGDNLKGVAVLVHEKHQVGLIRAAGKIENFD